MMLLMQRNRRSDFEGREHYGVRYDMPRSRYIEPYGYDEPLGYYDQRNHGAARTAMQSGEILGGNERGV